LLPDATHDVQTPLFKKNPFTHPIAFPESPDEHPSAFVVSEHAKHYPPDKKAPTMHDVATGVAPSFAPVDNGIHYYKSEFKINPVKQV